jgi:glutamine amidotransferase
MITIINYGLGKVSAFYNIYRSLNISTKIACRPDDLHDATHIVLPGVGSYDKAISLLEENNLKDAIIEKIQDNVNLLGICIGMHVLGTRSDEGTLKGLNVIPGVVRKINHNKSLIPHMGWNNIIKKHDNSLMGGIGSEDYFYFLHSYSFLPDDRTSVISDTEYSCKFVSGINKGNIYGIQFHPEKSHKSGIKLLKNFAEI